MVQIICLFYNLTQIIKNICKQKPEKRTESEIQFLEKSVAEIEFFQEKAEELKMHEYNNLLRAIQLIEVKKYQPILSLGIFLKKFVNTLGEIGKDFFILISGSVYILLPKNDLKSNGKRIGQKKSTHKNK